VGALTQAVHGRRNALRRHRSQELANRARAPLAADRPRFADQSLPFCVDINAATLLQRGISEDKLWALEDWRGSNLFDERERAALEYAEAVTLSDLEVDDVLMAQLRVHFDEDALVDLTALIAFQNMSSKFNAALDVPPQGFCRLPQSGARR
jgi:alkylhydroperoxidase family enzyme